VAAFLRRAGGLMMARTGSITLLDLRYDGDSTFSVDTNIGTYNMRVKCLSKILCRSFH